MLHNMDLQKLSQVAQALVTRGKGILAADESTGTIEKRLAKINVPSTEDSRRAYRQMLLTAPGMEQYISGVIFYDETFRQSTTDGKPFLQLLKEIGVLPGIKVDKGAVPMSTSPNEMITTGLDSLPQRLVEYAQMGAAFAKWRAVITIGDGLPTPANITQNAKDLAQYAKYCQEAGIVPIIEPEVLMDGSHSMARCEEVTRQVIAAVFEELRNAGVAMEGIILKTNMIVPGKESGQKASPEEVATATLKVLSDLLPNTLPGEAFLSGGQGDVEATANLNAMNQKGPFPWKLSFSYGRALQDAALKAWGGKQENVLAAQKTFLHRAKMNSLASLGKYSEAEEDSLP